MSELGDTGSISIPKREKKAPVVAETPTEAKAVDTEAPKEVKAKVKPYDRETNTDSFKVKAKVKPNEVKDSVEKPAEEVEEKEIDDSVVELIEDAKEIENSKETEEGVEEAIELEAKETTKEVVEQKAEEPKTELPEGLDSMVKFMQETGGSIEDYVRLNADYSNSSDEQLLKEYYKRTQPHYDADDIAFKIEEMSYDEDLDDDKDIRRKKLQLKEEVSKAKKHLEGMKDDYYKEVKLSSKLNPEQKEAVEFYNSHKEDLKISEARRNDFSEKTDSLLNNEFKGFEFEINKKKYRHNVKDVSNVKKAQSDITNILGKYFDEQSGNLKDPSGYHKALYAAANADLIAEQFLNQGRAEALKEVDSNAKNIQMNGRKDHSSSIKTKGITVKTARGDDSNKLKIKFKPPSNK